MTMRRLKLMVVVAFTCLSLTACNRSSAPVPANAIAPATADTLNQQTADAELTKRLTAQSASIADDVAVSIVHVESGRSVAVDGAKKLQLYSVFKVPLAIAVLKGVEEKKISLDQKVHVTPGDVAPGSQFNTDLWRQPVDKTVEELLEFSIVRSDNSSSDKLLQLVGGPAAVTQRMRALGYADIDIVSTVRDFAAKQENPNVATSGDLARLLTQLQKGELVQPANAALLLGFMERARTGGERRLRANLPAGTLVADKTGSGTAATNDIGVITLPEGKGHLAIAVLINGTESKTDAQEKLIAEIARAAYDTFVSTTATAKQ
jgi:beta-lactamase class A